MTRCCKSSSSSTAYPNRAARERTWGTRYLISAPILLALLYFLLQSWIAVSARLGRAPNQGAMLIAFLVFVVGGIAAFVFFAKGIVLVVKNVKASRNSEPE